MAWTEDEVGLLAGPVSRGTQNVPISGVKILEVIPETTVR